MSTTQQLRFAFATGSMRFTRLDRECMRVLERAAKGHDEVWAATSAVANKLGLTVRAAQLRIQRLERLGLVERVWDFALNTRRRLVLLWRRAATCGDGVSAEVCAGLTKTSAPTGPPALPIRSELSMEREIEIPHRPEPAAPTPQPELTTTNFEPVSYSKEGPLGRALLSAGVPPDVLHAPPGPATLAEAMAPLDPSTRAHSRATEPDPEDAQRKATPAEVARTVARVKRLFPQVQDPGRFVKTLAVRLRLNGDRVGIQWVSDAVDWAEYKEARSQFYLTTTIENWVAHGHPGKPPVKRAPVMQNFNPQAAPAAEAPLTEEDLAALERLAAGHGPAARMARLHLDRIKAEAGHAG
jgi:hypothetical protein